MVEIRSKKASTLRRLRGQSPEPPSSPRRSTTFLRSQSLIASSDEEDLEPVLNERQRAELAQIDLPSSLTLLPTYPSASSTLNQLIPTVQSTSGPSVVNREVLNTSATVQTTNVAEPAPLQTSNVSTLNVNAIEHLAQM